MKHIIHLGGKPIVLVYKEFEDDIEVNDFTKIDYSNLYGEVVTIATLQNRIGQLRAEAEKIMDIKDMEVDIMEAELKKMWRRDAVTNNGKFNFIDKDGKKELVKLTEGSLNDCVTLDVGWQTSKKNYIKAKRDYGYVDSFFWAIGAKSKKLENMLSTVTPEEFYNEIIEGSINGFVIRKPEIKYNK